MASGKPGQGDHCIGHCVPEEWGVLELSLLAAQDNINIVLAQQTFQCSEGRAHKLCVNDKQD